MDKQPDAGKRLEVKLEKSDLTVAPGSIVTTALEITSNKDTEEVVELRFQGIAAGWVTTPRAMIRILPGEKKRLILSAHPPLPPDGKVGRYPFFVVLTSTLNPEFQLHIEASLTVAAYEVFGRLNALVESTEYAVEPDGYVAIRLLIRNDGRQADTFEALLEGIPPEWVSTTANIFPLSAGEDGLVSFNIHPPPTPRSRAGRFPVVLRILSQLAPADVVEVGVTLTIAALEVKGRVGILLESTQFAIAPGDAIDIPVVLFNGGLEEDYFTVSAEGIPPDWIPIQPQVIQLEPGEQKEVLLTIHPPRISLSAAGPNNFKVRVTSQKNPSQYVLADCTLTLLNYSGFGIELKPARIEAGQTARVLVNNRGNMQNTFQVNWFDEDDSLVFTPVNVQKMSIPPGKVGVTEFQVTPRQRQIFGSDLLHKYTVLVRSAEKQEQRLNGEVMSKARIPIWAAPVIAVLCVGMMCFSALLSGIILTRSRPDVYSTQTASVNQTAAVDVGEQDADGDGLTDREERELGTDPNNPESDGDQLWDGEEVTQHNTNPLNPDTDGDSLWDGEEIARGTDPSRPDSDTDTLIDGDEVQRGTDPLNPDSEGDQLGDGDEVQRGTDPLQRDTDEDDLHDGQEVQLRTDPLKPDTDNDKLLDGKETLPCPDPLNPDTDGDGVIDGIDLDPCDPVNPSLTASVIPPTATLTPPTITPTQIPTVPVIDLGPGTILFESNRDGNAEIYSTNTQTFNVNRLTNNPAVDTQPDWSPDGTRIAFASNRTGDFDIYIMDADGSDVTNLTDEALADDLYPSWSPDGNWIVFSTNRDGNQEIYTIQVAGPDIRNISNKPDSNENQPDWYRSDGVLIGGELVVYVSNQDGNTEIYRMKADGSEQTRLTNNSFADVSPNGLSDGNRIVFTSERDGNPEVYVMDADGGNLVRLTSNPASDLYPAWKPGGVWITFTSNRDLHQEIYAMRNDGSQVFNVTKNTAQDLYPAWR